MHCKARSEHGMKENMSKTSCCMGQLRSLECACSASYLQLAEVSTDTSPFAERQKDKTKELRATKHNSRKTHMTMPCF